LLPVRGVLEWFPEDVAGNSLRELMIAF